MKQCKQCKREFVPYRSNQGFCDKLCNRKYWTSFTGREGHKDVNTGTVGAMAELLVSYDLLSKGWETFRALSPACSCDLIISKNNKNLRLEVRTGYRGKTGNLTYSKKPNGIIDNFAVVIHSSKEIIYIPEII